MFNLEKKFSKEIQTLRRVKDPADVLTVSEAQAVKDKVLLAIKQNQPKIIEQESYFWQERRQRIFRYAAAAVLGLSLISGTAFASNSAKPGDILYPVKIIKEKVQLSLAVSEEAKANLQAQFAGERLKELEQISLQSKNLAVSVASGTIISEGNNNQSNLEVKAKLEAGAEVNSALGALQKVQLELESKGQTRAAESIGSNILKLENQAQSQNIAVPGSVDNGWKNINGHGRDENKNSAASSTPSGLPLENSKGSDIKSPFNFKQHSGTTETATTTGESHLNVYINSDKH